MTGPEGHFEHGKWIREHAAEASRQADTTIDRRIAEARSSMISSIDKVLDVTHDLVTTDEGRKFLEKTIRDTQTDVGKSFDEMADRVKGHIEKNLKK